MLETFGLPTHILLLHSVVVLAPLAGIGGILYAVRPRWARALEIPVALLGLVAAMAAVLTASAGEALEEALPGSSLIEEHAEQGDLLELVAVVFAGAVVVLAALSGPWLASRLPFLSGLRANRWLVTSVRVLTVLAGMFLIYQTVVTGHTGAQAAWADWRTR